jgi:Zn-dependent oligopeptidase
VSSAGEVAAQLNHAADIVQAAVSALQEASQRLLEAQGLVNMSVEGSNNPRLQDAQAQINAMQSEVDMAVQHSIGLPELLQESSLFV